MFGFSLVIIDAWAGTNTHTQTHTYRHTRKENKERQTKMYLSLVFRFHDFPDIYKMLEIHIHKQNQIAALSPNQKVANYSI